MTMDELKNLAADRGEVRRRLARWSRLRWNPSEADSVSEQIAAIVERPLTLAKAQYLSAIWVAEVLSQALSFFANEPDGFMRPNDWPRAVSCYELRNIEAAYMARLRDLVLPMEIIITEAA